MSELKRSYHLKKSKVNERLDKIIEADKKLQEQKYRKILIEINMQQVNQVNSVLDNIEGILGDHRSKIPMLANGLDRASKAAAEMLASGGVKGMLSSIHSKKIADLLLLQSVMSKFFQNLPQLVRLLKATVKPGEGKKNPLTDPPANTPGDVQLVDVGSKGEPSRNPDAVANLIPEDTLATAEKLLASALTPPGLFRKIFKGGKIPYVGSPNVLAKEILFNLSQKDIGDLAKRASPNAEQFAVNVDIAKDATQEVEKAEAEEAGKETEPEKKQPEAGSKSQVALKKRAFKSLLTRSGVEKEKMDRIFQWLEKRNVMFESISDDGLKELSKLMVEFVDNS